MILRNETSGVSHKLGEKTLIGRSPRCDITLGDDGVSRRHAEILQKGNGFFIKDLGSKNGTFVNGVELSSSVPLSAGDIVRIGKAAFSVEPGVDRREAQRPATEDLVDSDPSAKPVSDLADMTIDGSTLQFVEEGEITPRTQEVSLAGERLQLLADLMASVRAAAGLAELEHNVASQMLALFPGSMRCIILFRGSDRKLTIRAVVPREGSKSPELKVSSSVVNYVLDESRGILCSDVMSDAHYSPSESMRALGIHSFICAPLLGTQGAFGAVYLDTVDAKEQFGPQDLALLTMVANQTSLAIEKTQLVEQLSVERDQLAEENLRFRAQQAQACDLGHIVCVSKKMQKVLDLTRKIAPTDCHVLITGPSGTGKELIAHAIHYASGRSDKAFEVVNCAALSGQLAESELFGHEKGAFTGADRAKPGIFEIANHGTLFLDEIGELPFDVQAKLLRATEHGQIRRLGATKDIEVDVRLIAATNKDLEIETEEKRFRLDLYHRLSVATIEIPPLSERREDILPLANHFIAILGRQMAKPAVGLSEGAIAVLQQHDWPGNARELRNVLERAMIEMTGDTIGASHLPTRLIESSPDIARYKEAGKLRDAETALKRAMITDALRETEGNKTKAAEILGISRPGLRKMMRDLGMDSPGAD